MPTKLSDIINPQVMSDMIEAKTLALCKLTPYAKVDTTLQGTAGDTKTVPSWNYVGDAEDFDPESGSEMKTAKLTASSRTFTIKCAGKSVSIYQTAINSGLGNPIGQAETQLAKSITGKIDNDVLDVAYKGSKLNAITGMTTEEFEKNALMLLGSQNAYMTQSEAVEYLQNKYDGLSEKFLGVRNRFIDTEKSFVDYNTTIKNYEGVSAAIVSKDSDKIKQANYNMLNSFQTAETGTERSLRNQVTSCETEYENMLKAYKQGNANKFITTAEEFIKGYFNSTSYNSGESSIADYVAGVKSGNIPRFANGGIVDRATIAQIGEDGPEAVVPLKNNTEWIDRVAEKVAGKLGKGGNGGGVTVNYIFENVNMNSDSDLEENAYKFEAMRRKAEMAMGGI